MRKKISNIQTGSGDKSYLKIKKSFKSFSPETENKANTLLRYIKRENLLKWNDNFEIIYKNKTIRKSNIISLIKYVVKNILHDEIKKPKGFKIFYKIINKSNLPKFVISNKIQSKIRNTLDISDTENEKTMWRPPGELQNKRKRKKRIS